jgi:hypothetical protein
MLNITEGYHLYTPPSQYYYSFNHRLQKQTQNINTSVITSSTTQVEHKYNSFINTSHLQNKCFEIRMLKKYCNQE